MSKEIVSNQKSSNKEKPKTRWFTSEFHQTFKVNVDPFHSLPKADVEGTLPKLIFMRPALHVTSKPDKDTSKKKAK